jgi:uncharacterized protein with HEPN domain
MWRDDAYLLDILLAARRALEYTAGKTADDFARDDILQNAVMRLVHDYFRVDVNSVWDTVQQDLRPLIAAVEPLVPPDTPDGR